MPDVAAYYYYPEVF
jgi:hypothetical protein